jgi:hypothetical protein
MANKTTLEVLEEAKALLAKPGVWQQGAREYFDNDGKAHHCALGALDEVVGGYTLAGDDTEAFWALYEALPKRPEKASVDMSPAMCIARFNDRQSSRAPVLRLFSRAIRRVKLDNTPL